ncbi:MAG: endonuclease/exonuclease/phosphatase family protein [Treponema sp.]|nr:endonuclease/exonuclease/phosphatase family protein [Treponema sp.]
MFFRKTFLLSVILIFFCTSCSSGKTVSIVNWNVQTFFDSNNDGIEYTEFLTDKKWGREMYTERLKKLCSVIKKSGADIFVMEELENEKVLHDIYNFLAGEWNFSKVYAWSCFAKTPGTSIGCGVLSRIPLSDLKVHALDIRGSEKQPGLRPLIEVTVCLKNSPFVLFVSHWKSKSGGKEKTEPWRNREEAVLAKCVSKAVSSGKRFVCCGDFNRDINDFLIEDCGTVCLRFFDDVQAVKVYSPWFSDGKLIEPGSYFFKDEWSRIDNFFVDEKSYVKSYEVLTEGPWCYEESKVPVAFRLYNGSGYSDHLPVKLELNWN